MAKNLQIIDAVDEDLKLIRDEDGTDTALELSKDKLKINGDLECSGIRIGDIIKLNSSKLDVPDAFEIQTGRGGDITLDSAGDITLDAGGLDINFAAGGVSYLTWNATGVLTMKAAVDTGDYLKFNVANTGISTISTNDDSGGNLANFSLNIEGDITLNSKNGIFIQKNNDVEFSVAGSAYAGMILGIRVLGHNAARVGYTILNSFETLHADATVRFIAPPSGVVEVFVQAGYLDAISGRYIYFGLSDNATYNTIGAQHEETVNLTDALDQQIIQNTWIISGLTAGDTYNYWFGLKSSGIGGGSLNYGGTGTGHYSPFIMKVTALPAATADIAVYD